MSANRWWWLSFADEERFYGACVVGPCTTDLGDAVMMAHQKGINPGGEALGLCFPESHSDFVPERFRNRLLNKEESLELDKIIADNLTESRK